MEITFKPIQYNDKSMVLELFKKAAQNINKKNIDHWQYWHNPPLEKIQWVEEGIKHNEFFFIETLDQKNLGMVRILSEDTLYWGIQNESAKYIHSLVVNAEFNGKGLGAKIIQKIETQAKQDDCQFLRLDADSKNQKLCHYYEKLGFKKVGTKKLTLSIYNLYQKTLK